MSRVFDKYEGLGNDFVVVDATDERDLPAAEAAALCDRRFGVGGDGVLLVLPPRVPGADARMRVLNADGSVPEMCGNGVRCVALRAALARGVAGGTIVVDTDAGSRACEVSGVDPARGRGRVAVDMGPVRFHGYRAIEIDGRPVVVAVADAGNPHAVLVGSFTRAEVEHLGPRIATHASFPRGTNVEFALAGADGIDLVVWERGVGITMACGTGACATVAVTCEKALTRRGAPTTVRLPGGALEIVLSEDGRATMTGPARRVFSGRLDGTWT
jgi:diaminopimelate epimerase